MTQAEEDLRKEILKLKWELMIAEAALDKIKEETK